MNTDTLCGCDADFFSIPQQNKVLQSLSISSLCIYSSWCRFFVIVAPPATHVGSEKQCSAQTYQRRGWCRLEQMARICAAGLEGIYLYSDEGHDRNELRPVKDLTCEANKESLQRSTSRHDETYSWHEDSIRVFDGEFTMESDKAKLVDTMLALWASVLYNQDSADNRQLVQLVNAHKAEVFPTEFFGDVSRSRARTVEF